ncbi:MAG: hypothetical protein L6275_04910 [Candidatus Portnoybacteria bacterium]|nr:hypothetical protein [Candidatus Portnoybacteria bacterium]
MTQTNLLKKMSNDLSSVQEELARMRSIVLGFLVRDKEGRYQTKFTQKILKAAKEKPIYKFKNEHDFLSQIKKS